MKKTLCRQTVEGNAIIILFLTVVNIFYFVCILFRLNHVLNLLLNAKLCDRWTDSFKGEVESKVKNSEVSQIFNLSKLFYVKNKLKYGINSSSS